MQPVEIMKSLINSLPSKDRNIAYSLIEKRRFEDLWDLVKSAIYKVRRNTEKYPEVNIADMNILKSEISLYLDQLNIDEYEDDELLMDDYEEYK